MFGSIFDAFRIVDYVPTARAFFLIRHHYSKKFQSRQKVLFLRKIKRKKHPRRWPLERTSATIHWSSDVWSMMQPYFTTILRNHTLELRCMVYNKAIWLDQTSKFQFMVVAIQRSFNVRTCIPTNLYDYMLPTHVNSLMCLLIFIIMLS